MRLASLVFLGVSSISCRAGVVGQAVRPTEPTATHALDGKPGKCRTTDGPAEPLVVDWQSQSRADLELAMRKGVAVIAYDCEQLKLLDACSIDGSYAFAGVTRKEESVQIVDHDELAANVPLGKATLSAALDRGSSLDIALVMIGKQATTVASAARPQLRGSCEGATHFVRGAYVGAFAVTTGTAGKVQAVADIFGAGAKGASSSDRNTATRDGDLEACRSADAKASAPPERCGVAIRLQLAPISDAAVSSDAATKTEAAPCPEGLVWAQGKCTAAAAKTAHLCRPDDEADCKAQCELGDAGSCYSYAGFVGRSDVDAALALYERACDGGQAGACWEAGFVWTGRANAAKTDDARIKARLAGEKRLAQSCELGDGWACWNTAPWYLRTGSLEVFPRDPARAMSLLRRGCDLGYAPSCSSLAAALMAGKDTKRDVPAALGLLVRGCDGGRAEDCSTLGDLQLAGTSVARDPEAALAAYRKGCERAGAIACSHAGDLLAKGDGVAKDERGALEMWSRACNEKLAGWDACKSLGAALERGAGTTKDAAAAAVAYERGCMKGGCFRAGEIWEKGLGTAADKAKALAAYQKGCQMSGDKNACKAAKRLTP